MFCLVLILFSSSFFNFGNRHVSPRGTIKCVFFQNLKGMASSLCVQQATLINGNPFQPATADQITIYIGSENFGKGEEDGIQFLF